MTTLYLVCLLLGVAYAVFVGFLGDWLGFEHGDGDVGADTGEVHFMPFSPSVIACFVAGFGAGGLIMDNMLHLPKIFGVIGAIATGVVTGGGTGYLMYRIKKVAEATSQPRESELVGIEAEVTTSIPAEGCGEISFIAKGTRLSGAARSEDHKPIPTHALVVISRIAAGMYIVREHVEEKLSKVPE